MSTQKRPRAKAAKKKTIARKPKAVTAPEIQPHTREVILPEAVATTGTMVASAGQNIDAMEQRVATSTLPSTPAEPERRSHRLIYAAVIASVVFVMAASYLAYLNTAPIPVPVIDIPTAVATASAIPEPSASASPTEVATPIPTEVPTPAPYQFPPVDYPEHFFCLGGIPIGHHGCGVKAVPR